MFGFFRRIVSLPTFKTSRFISSLVIIEHNNQNLNKLNYNVISAATKLGNVSCLVAGYNCTSVAETVSRIEGVSKVIIADNPVYKNIVAEILTPLVLATHTQIQSSHIITGCTVFGKNLLPRVASQLNVSPISDVIQILDEHTFKRPIYAGNALVTLRSLDSVKCLSIRPASFSPSCLSDSTPAPTYKAPEITDFPQFSEFVCVEENKCELPDLGSAEIVVSGGRGLKSAENFKLIFDLAKKLNAAVGASRAAVDAGFVTNDLQIGQTGKIVAPKLYIAVGISGAIQHLAGMKDSKVIVAINTDPDAPIFQIADYSLVDDLFKAVPKFISLI